jgi:oligoendopeptidase F
MKFIKEFETFETKTSKLYGYAGLKFSENSSDHEIAALKTQVEQLMAEISNKLLFFGLWFKDLSDEKANELIKSSGDYSYFLESIRKTKPYTLTELEEKIITIKDVTGYNALNNVYDILTSQFEYEYKGKKLNQNELRTLVYDPSAKVRKEAYSVLFSKYVGYKDLISEVYKQLVSDWREENVKLRGYKSPISVRNMSNDLPDKSVEALLKVCKKNQSLFHKFFSLKAKEIGLDKLTRFDLYAPINKDSGKISYDESINLVLDTFGEFSNEFKEAALKVIDAGHLHSKIQKNKNTGAFCWGVTNTELPYVLLNFAGTLRDVSTLAHELGHAVHDVLAQHQTEFTHHSALPLAETASTFAELLLLDKLIEKNPDKAKSLIFSQLDNFYATIIRQANFTQFEINAHSMISEGKNMQEISDKYYGDLKEQLGSSVEIDEIFKNEWLHVPHFFHTPFYCYAYSFGNLFTLALYEMYKEEGETFVPKFLELLSKGGSQSPEDVAKAVGVDITSEKFWEKGFEVIEELIKKLEKI